MAARGECCSCIGQRSGSSPLTPASLAQNLTPSFSDPSGHLWVCVNTHKHMHVHRLQNKKREKGKWVGHANQAGPGAHTSNPTTEAETGRRTQVQDNPRLQTEVKRLIFE